MKASEEREYLEKNNKFNTEKTLLSSMTNDEIKDFISPIHNEYSNLKTSLQKIAKYNKNKFQDLSELEKHFLEVQIFMAHWWDTLEVLENILQVVESHLYSELPKDKSRRYNYKHIDINQISICDVIWRYTKLPSYCKRKNIRCPLHNDKTPSFKIYIETNSFYCFGCLKWWNAINFISEIENISTKEAFKRVIEMFNLNY